MGAQQSSFGDDNYKQDFKLLADQLARLGTQLDLNIRPYHDDELPGFSSLDSQQQFKSLKALRTYLEICEQTMTSGYQLDSVKLIWFALQKFGLRPPAELFEYIKGNNVVEVHTLEGIQIFRNFNFYGLCSYTIEELYCEPWHGLYRHQNSSLPVVQKFVSDVTQGILTGVRYLNLKNHVIQENFSLEKLTLDSYMIYGSPLFSMETGAPVATLVVEEAEIIKSVSPRPESSGPEISTF